VVGGFAEPAGPDLDRLADTIIVGRVVVEAGEFVGDLDLPVGAGGISVYRLIRSSPR
jgi:hypothetical protein